MFQLAVLIQILAILSCLTAVLIVAFQKPSSYSHVILITFLCGFVQNGAYLLELTARNYDQAMVAVKAEYLGGAFEICLITYFIFKYCGHQMRKSVLSFLIFEGCIVLLGVWTWEFNHAYYTDAVFIANATFPHLTLMHGWLYYAFSVTVFLELFACLFILAVSILKTNQQHMKYNFIVLLFVVLVPLSGFTLAITGIFGGFDATPLSAAIAISIFAFAIARKHVFDVADAAGELILSDLDSAIIIVNNEGGYEYSNKRANVLYPVLADYARGAIISDISITNLFDESRPSQFNLGSRRYEVKINKVKANDVEIGKTAMLIDVTEAKNQIEQMQSLMNAAENANKSKSAFLANVSHEIRTPINVVMGMSEILLRDHSTKETEEYIVNIRNSSRTLLNLIGDILDFSKLESGKLEINESRFDLKKMLTDLVNVFDFRCRQKSLEFNYEISEEIPRYMIGDELRIHQIAMNLLTNAVKFTDTGSVSLRVGFKYRSDFDLDLILAVEDTGVGIPREHYHKLFTEFSREDLSYNTNVEGTGLGLSITKQLTEMMGGAINFKSNVGEGTAFSVVIPIRTVTDNSEFVGEISCFEQEEKIYRTSFTCRDADVLVVDDSQINLLVVKELLRDIECNIILCSSGEECLDIVRKRHFDLIFMDHRMPGMDGVETFSRIKQSDNMCQTTPVIMITANATNEAREWYLSKGFTDFIPMPVSSERLANMLYKYLPDEMIHMIE